MAARAVAVVAAEVMAARAEAAVVVTAVEAVRPVAIHLPTARVVPANLSRSLIAPVVVVAVEAEEDSAPVETNSGASPVAENQAEDVAKEDRRSGTAIEFAVNASFVRRHGST